jgi:hypothetical protein
MSRRRGFIETSKKCPQCGVGTLRVCNFKSAVDVREEYGKLIITHAYEIICTNPSCNFDHDGWTEKVWD